VSFQFIGVCHPFVKMNKFLGQITPSCFHYTKQRCQSQEKQVKSEKSLEKNTGLWYDKNKTAVRMSHRDRKQI